MKTLKFFAVVLAALIVVVSSTGCTYIKKSENGETVVFSAPAFVHGRGYGYPSQYAGYGYGRPREYESYYHRNEIRSGWGNRGEGYVWQIERTNHRRSGWGNHGY